jgi:hypothetical protein
MKDSYWSYKVDYSGYENQNLALLQLLSTIEPSKTVIQEITEQYETYIYFSLRSNSGQLGFELEPKTIKALSDLNIKLEVHILSYGEVDQ